MRGVEKLKHVKVSLAWTNNLMWVLGNISQSTWIKDTELVRKSDRKLL